MAQYASEGADITATESFHGRNGSLDEGIYGIKSQQSSLPF